MIAKGSLLIAEIAMTRLSYLHSIAHLLIYIPALIIGFSNLLVKNVKTNIICLATIGTTLVNHRHDLNPIAYNWHTAIGVNLILSSVLTYTTFFTHNFYAIKLLSISFKFTGNLLILMAICLHSYRDGKDVKGIHNF